MELTINNIENIGSAAEEFLSLIEQGRVYAFYGEMGAGKTTFVKAVCEAMGVEDVVTSPSFAIVNEYQSKTFPVYHFDFYRINDLREVYDMGYEEYFYGSGVCFIEWPELVERLLPDDVVRVEITVADDGTRRIAVAE